MKIISVDNFDREHMEELERRRERCAYLQGQVFSAEAQFQWIEMALNGEELGDFALSFSIVRKVYDLYKRAQIDHECILERGEIIDRLS